MTPSTPSQCVPHLEVAHKELNAEPAEIKYTDDSKRRYLGILHAGISSVFSKSAILLVNLISVPIVARYLGPIQFGIWATITTSLSLFLALDLGIANTLNNLISEAYALKDKSLASVYSSTAFWMVCIIVSLLGLAGWIAWPYLNWNYIFNVNTLAQNVASRSTAVAYLVFLFAMPASLCAKLLAGYQELRIANIFAAIGNIASLFGMILVVRIHGGLPMLVLASSGALVLANIICLLWLWLHHKPWLMPLPSKVSLAAGRRLLHTGSEFFILQLAAIVVFNSDNLVIAHFVGAAEVTPYNVTWRLVGYASVLQNLTLPAIWPAYTEAFVRGDLDWVRKTFRKIMASTMAVAIFFCTIFLFFGQFLIRHWAGPSAVPSAALIFWMCIWVLISTFMGNDACILLAASETRLQAWSSVIGAIANLGLSLWLVHTMGSIGVILGTIISYIIFLVAPQVWKVAKILNPATGDYLSAKELT